MFRQIGKSVNVIDITPSRDPISLAREMERKAPKAKAGLAVLIDEDGLVWYDMAGCKNREVLWALQKMIHELMEGR